MPFIPRLPTFHNDVTVYKYDPDTDTWEEQEELLTGQIYTQLRTQDDSTRGTLYFEYPKEHDILRDLSDYNDVGKSDVLLVSFPTPAPRVLGYRVRDVQPRWLGFPNEHLMATLDRLTPDETEIVTDGPPPPPPPPDEETQIFSTYASVPYSGSGVAWTADPIGAGMECFPDDTTTTEQLNIRGPAFSIPSGATIVGCRVRVYRGQDSPGGSVPVVDATFRVRNWDTGVAGAERASVDPWPNFGSGPVGYNTVYGSDNDDWNLLGTSPLTEAALNAGHIQFELIAACLTSVTGTDLGVGLFGEFEVTVYYTT